MLSDHDKNVLEAAFNTPEAKASAEREKWANSVPEGLDFLQIARLQVGLMQRGYITTFKGWAKHA